VSEATAIAKEPKKSLSIKEQLNSPDTLQQIARTLPKHMDADRMCRVALTALTRTPKLADCTKQSFFKCLLDLSSWGLEPDGRHAHLIPYGDQCTLVLDYKGIVQLAYRSGFVKNIHADVVRSGDVFEYNLGKVTRHTPWVFRFDEHKPESSGDVIAAYCVVEMQDGATHHEVMRRDELDAIQKRSRAGSSGPWITDPDEMRKKTVFRRASKWLPLSAEQVDAFDRDADRPVTVAKKAEAISVEDVLG
jgi:recombination protein RecT